MNSTTIITGAGAITGTGLSLYDKDNKKINKKNAKSLVMTSVSTTGTAIAGSSLNYQTKKQIYEKYASAYVESMSDEELEQALMELDLLESGSQENRDIKTI